MSYISDDNLNTVPANITGKFRDVFETFTDGAKWNLSQDSNDIVQLDGNAASASYLVISKDPLTTGGVTTLTSIDTFTMPVELAVGLCMSQRALGQELSMEAVSDEEPLASFSELAISSISQSTTVLTVNTATPHGLVPGKRIGIYGCVDSRLNYPALVVASIPSSTQFTATAGPAGTIASLTLSGAAAGYVYYRPSLGYAKNGVSQIFENTSTTNASIYVRASAGDALPSGTILGSHATTVATTSPTQAINAANTYSFLPSTEYRISLAADRAMFYDAGVDTASAPTNRLVRTQVVPDPQQQYKLRFRFTNNKALPIPNAKIVSVSKSGSTVAVITTDIAHGLTVGDYINIYGIGDSANFANATTAVSISAIPSSTIITVAFGASATATSAGGFVSRQQGSQSIQGVAAATVAQTSSTSTQLTLVNGMGSWALVIGDYVNVYGVRDRATGADLGVDGVYKVVNQVTSVLTLEPLAGTTLPSPISLTNTGGAVIRRTDLRLSFVRVFDYERQRVEVMAQPNPAAAVPVNVTGGGLSSLSTLSNGFLAYNQASADQTSAALTTTTTGSSITPTAGLLSYELNYIVTAVTGTNPTLDVVIQESDDAGTNWYDVYHFPRITAAGQYRTPLIPLTGNRIRWVQTLGGASPNFTRSINRLQSHISSPLQRQFFTRIDMNALNTATTSFFTEGCVDLNVVVAMGAITTTAPVLVFEVSADGSIWTQVGNDITTVANTALLVQLSNTQARFCRLRTKTAGSGASTNYIMVKGIGR